MKSFIKEFPEYIHGHISIQELLKSEIPLPAFLTAPINLSKLARPFPKKTRRAFNKSRPSASPRANGPVIISGTLSSGYGNLFTVSGKSFEVTEDTWIVGELIAGYQATVTLTAGLGETLQAKKIVSRPSEFA